MPLFEYRCQSCNDEFELLIRGDSVPVCPSCGSTLLEKQVSLFGVSSADTQRRSERKLGAARRAQGQTEQKEREFYKIDHHDD